MGAMQDEINVIKKENNTLQNQLKEALAKQHEAMRRALHLAERNKLLENELKDIDRIALAVEAEANDTVKNNAETVSRLQDRLNESVIMIQNLERENAKLKLEKIELSSDLDAIRVEKKYLQTLLDTETEDKKRLANRINNLTIIEHDLNIEIDRLVSINAEQKRKIAELECLVTAGKVQVSSISQLKPLDHMNKKPASVQVDSMHPKLRKGAAISDNATKSTKQIASKRIEHKKTCRKALKHTVVQDSTNEAELPSVIKCDESQIPSQIPKCCCETGSCVKQMKELLDKEIEYRQSQVLQQLDCLKQEKDYYMKEYHKLADQMRSMPCMDRSDKLQEQFEELLKKIEEKNQTIVHLQNENKSLVKEKYAPSKKYEERADSLESDKDSVCQKTSCKRKSRELEIHREELKHMEKENNSYRAKIQELTQSTVFNEERMKKAFQDMEEHIRKLEDERRDLVLSQCTSRSNVTQLEEECNALKGQLKGVQNELNIQKANYTQLKNLHDQINRALSDAQNQVVRAETDLQQVQSTMSNTHRESLAHEQEIARLNSDIDIMKSQLSKIDKEKDDLLNKVDEKTEKIYQLEHQLKEEKQNRNLLSKMDKERDDLLRLVDEKTELIHQLETQLKEKDNIIKTLESESKEMKRSLKRLQDDLTSATCDCRCARKELEISKRQVEDLTRQLQQYVAEVKRTEDLISQKELERTAILDQFKCLSEEANILESNNHTLENEATQSRVQLTVALDHASDLERKIENQQSIIRSYERQISDLTSQVASMEIQMKQANSHTDRVSTELNQMKDLCVKLDHEKDSIRRELRSRDDQRRSVEKIIDKLSRENEDLKRALEKERNNLDGLEKLLNEARQEVVEQRLLNQDLQLQFSKMRSKVDEVQMRLSPRLSPDSY